MGAGAAALFALHGARVTLVVRRSAAAGLARERVEMHLRRLVELGVIDSSERESALRRVETSLGLNSAEVYGLVFEAISEAEDAKRSALADAESVLAADGIIASTTSSISIGALAAGLSDASKFAGWHWLNPAALVPLVEIVPWSGTSPLAVATLTRWSELLGKQPITLRRDVPGFAVNRLQYALLREAYWLVEEGVCSFDDVDLAVTAGLGLRWASIGPFATMDLAGLEVHAAVASSLFPQLHCGHDVPAPLAELRESGATGAKGGLGLLGPYSTDKITELEWSRDRTIMSLRPGCSND